MGTAGNNGNRKCSHSSLVPPLGGGNNGNSVNWAGGNRTEQSLRTEVRGGGMNYEI